MASDTQYPNNAAFRLATLLLFITLIAMGCAALAYPTRWWASIISTTVFCLLSLASMAAVLLRGSRRAFWTGFALFGWMYVIVQFVRLPTINFDKSLLLPEMVLEQIAAWRYPDSSNWYFSYIGKFLSAIFSAVVGGLLARFCCCIRDSPEGRLFDS